MTTISPNLGLNSPALLYQEISYADLLTDPFADNEQMWVAFADSMTTLFDDVVHFSADQLYFMRSDKNDPLYVAYNTRMLGFQVPLNSFSNSQYVNLLQSLGTFYQTKGASLQFLNFLSYIENTEFTFIPLWANSLSNNVSELTDTPGTPVWEGGTYFPTPYYDLQYNQSQYPNLDTDAFVQLLYQISPIYLVPRSIEFKENTTSPIYITPVTYDTHYTRTIASYP